MVACEFARAPRACGRPVGQSARSVRWVGDRCAAETDERKAKTYIYVYSTWQITAARNLLSRLNPEGLYKLKRQGDSRWRASKSDPASTQLKVHHNILPRLPGPAFGCSDCKHG